jgi:nucleotide-binding universal stress UspA family protein
LRAAVVSRHIDRLWSASEYLDAVGLDEQIYDEGAPGLALAIDAVAAVRKERLVREPVADGAASTAAVASGAHRAPGYLGWSATRVVERVDTGLRLIEARRPQVVPPRVSGESGWQKRARRLQGETALRGRRDLRERSGFSASIEQPSDAVSAVTLRGIAYRHLLVAYDGTSEGDEAIVAADLLAQQDRCRLTIVVVVELERTLRWVTRWPRGTSVWNDVLLDRARADLKRAGRLVEAPAELTVLFGPAQRAIPEGAEEFGCDAIMLPPGPRRRLARLLSRNQAAAIRRRASCEVLQPR